MEENIQDIQKEVSERILCAMWVLNGIISEVNISCELLEKDISDIQLSERSKFILSELGIAKIKDLCAYSKQDLMDFVGVTCWRELKTCMKDVELPFGNALLVTPDNKVYAIGRRSLPYKVFRGKWKKNVRCVEKNKVYGSIRECSDDLGIPYMTIYNAITNKNATRGSKLHFDLIESEEKSEEKSVREKRREKRRENKNVCKKSMESIGVIIDGIEYLTQQQTTKMVGMSAVTLKRRVKRFGIKKIESTNGRVLYQRNVIDNAIKNGWFKKYI